MKNRVISIFSLFLAAVIFCGISGNTVKATGSAASKKAVDPTFAVVNDFEQISDLYELDWYGAYGMFGKAELNTDPAYVTSGSASIKLNPIGDYRANVSPTYIKLPLNRHKEHDASRLTSVSFDVFNATGKDRTISCALAIDGTNTKYVDFAVKNAERKNIVLEYDLIAMSAVYDINNVEGIYVVFPKAESRETQNGNVWYLDKFCAYYNPFELKGYEMSLDENEFCGFDKPYQEFFVNNNCGTGAIDGFRPELSINTDPMFCADKEDGKFVFGKNKSLKVVAKPGVTSGMAGFTFYEGLWHGFEWKEMNDKALEFDVFNDSDSAFNFSLIIFRNPDNYKTGYYDRFSGGFQVKPYTWTTVTMPIKAWNESTKNTNGNPMTSYIQYGKVVYTYGIPWFGYSCAAVGSSERTFYFDNFRIVDVQE